MSEAIDTTLVRSGTWGSLWIDGEQVAECYGCQAKISKTKESVPPLPRHDGGQQARIHQGHRLHPHL